MDLVNVRVYQVYGSHITTVSVIVRCIRFFYERHIQCYGRIANIQFRLLNIYQPVTYTAWLKRIGFYYINSLSLGFNYGISDAITALSRCNYFFQHPIISYKLDDLIYQINQQLNYFPCLTDVNSLYEIIYAYNYTCNNLLPLLFANHPQSEQ